MNILLFLPLLLQQSRRARCCALCLLLLLTGIRVEASQVRPVNLEEMTDRAATVFAGRCVVLTTTVDPDIGRTVTEATFDVSRAVKGNPGQTITVRFLGAQSSGVSPSAIAGPPPFRPDEEVILFLYGESALGFRSTVGFGQGKFSVSAKDPASPARGQAAGMVPFNPTNGLQIPVTVTLGAVTTASGKVVAASSGAPVGMGMARSRRTSSGVIPKR